MKLKIPPRVPIYDYSDGNNGTPVIEIPENTIYEWASTVGGGSIPEPVTFGTIMPNGKPAHGGVMTNHGKIKKIVYHKNQ